jgi:signal transduction histidine kinase
MTKKFLLQVTLLFLPLAFLCAQEIGHYKNIADTTSNDLIKLEAIDSLLKKTFHSDQDTFITYSYIYIDLAKKIDSIELAARKAMNLQYPLTAFKNSPQKAIMVINGILAHKYKIKDSFLLGGLYLKKGAANFHLDFNEAVKDYTLALENFSIRDSVHLADAYLFRGQANSSLGHFVSAGEDYNAAYTYYENLKDYEYMLHAQQGIITMFSMNGFYDLAKKERDEMIQNLKELGLTEYLATEYYNQALDYRKTGKNSLQLESLLEAKRHQNDSLNGKMFFNIHAKLAEYYSRNHQLEMAKKEINLLEPRYEKAKGDRLVELDYSGAKATYLKEIGDYENSLIFAHRKLENANNLGYEDEIMDSYQLLSEIYKEMGDFEKSLENIELYGTIRDSLYNRTNANSLAYYQTLFDIQEKEKELVEKNANIKLLEKDSQTFKKLMFFVSLAIMLIFGIILLYRNRQNLNSKKNLQEGFSQKLLVSQEQERMRISKDLHDGIGQQLLLIKNKLISSGDQSTMEIVDRTINEVRNISRDLHPFALQELGITKAIEHTLAQVDENTSLFISSEIDNIDNLFTPEEEVNIYRIVQESLSNIIKHGKAEASKVLVKRLTNNITISIKDNGVGFDFSEKYQDKKSLGLKTLLERTRFLNGQMKVNSKKESGTLLEFKFPI